MPNPSIKESRKRKDAPNALSKEDRKKRTKAKEQQKEHNDIFNDEELISKINNMEGDDMIDDNEAVMA